jgi:hypothetical protein
VVHVSYEIEELSYNTEKLIDDKAISDMLQNNIVQGSCVSKFTVKK